MCSIVFVLHAYYWISKIIQKVNKNYSDVSLSSVTGILLESSNKIDLFEVSCNPNMVLFSFPFV